MRLVTTGEPHPPGVPQIKEGNRRTLCVRIL